MKIFRWFTLLEIVMVLVVISVLMAVTLKFGANRVNDLKNSSLKDQTFDAISTVISEHWNSNYHEGIPYDRMNILFTSWSSEIVIAYIWSSETLFSWRVKLPDAVLLSNDFHISLEPYMLWCDVSWSGYLSLDVDGVPLCYLVERETCKLTEMPCE